MSTLTGFANGMIPASALYRTEVITGGGRLLRGDAGLALDRLGLLALADGYDTNVTDLYRDYATQVRLRKQWCDRGRCHMAATPGTSNHGWGVACDNGYGYGVKSFGRWMHANLALCRRNGWFWPAWAQSARQFEIWHFEYSATLDQHLMDTPDSRRSREDDDMIHKGAGPTQYIRSFQFALNRFFTDTGGKPSTDWLVKDGVAGNQTFAATWEAIVRLSEPEPGWARTGQFDFRSNGITSLDVLEREGIDPVLVSAIVAAAAIR